MISSKKGEFKVGDLVTTEWEYGNQMFEHFEERHRRWPTFRFMKGDVGLVLEVHPDPENPGIRLAVGDKVGWTHSAFYDKVCG